MTLPEKTQKIKDLLERRHEDTRQWVYIHEMPEGTGGACRGFIDGFAINCWHCNDLEKVAYEIKVSRSDFLKELKFPEKRRAALLFSNQYYFVTPKGLVKKEEIPLECGLIEWEGENLVVALKAPTRAAHPPSWTFMAAALRTYGHQQRHKNDQG